MAQQVCRQEPGKKATRLSPENRVTLAMQLAFSATTMQETLPVARWLRSLAAGDEAAWHALVEAFGPEMYARALRITACAQLADDAVQEALLRVRAGVADFVPVAERPDVAARAWVLRIVVTSALMLRRSAWRRARRERPMEVALDAIAPAEPVRQDHARELLAANLQALSEKDSQALVLHYYAGMDHQALASEWDCSPGAARVRVHRALSRLRQRMGTSALALAAAALLQQPLRAAELPAPEQMARWHQLHQAPLPSPSFWRGAIGGAVVAAGLVALTWWHGTAPSPIALLIAPPTDAAPSQDGSQPGVPASPPPAPADTPSAPSKVPAVPVEAAPAQAAPAEHAGIPGGLAKRQTAAPILCLDIGVVDLPRRLVVLDNGEVLRQWPDERQLVTAAARGVDIEVQLDRDRTLEVHLDPVTGQVTGSFAGDPVQGRHCLFRQAPRPLPAFLRQRLHAL
jgi:RNA polymerase sigma-70 factor, ECF subfamily